MLACVEIGSGRFPRSLRKLFRYYTILGTAAAMVLSWRDFGGLRGGSCSRRGRSLSSSLFFSYRGGGGEGEKHPKTSSGRAFWNDFTRLLAALSQARGGNIQKSE